jgi:hypothetical protein
MYVKVVSWLWQVSVLVFSCKEQKTSHRRSLCNIQSASVIFQMDLPPVSYRYLLYGKSEESTFMGHCETSCCHFSECSSVRGMYIFTSPLDIFMTNWILNISSIMSPLMNQISPCLVFTVVSRSVWILFHVCLNLQTAFFQQGAQPKFCVFLLCSLHPTHLTISLFLNTLVYKPWSSPLCKFQYSAVNLSQNHFVVTSPLFVPIVLCVWLLEPVHHINYALYFISHSKISRKCTLVFCENCTLLFLVAESCFKGFWPVGRCALLTKDWGFMSSGMWCTVAGLIVLAFIFEGWGVQAECQVWETGRNVYVCQSSWWRPSIERLAKQFWEMWAELDCGP